MKAPVYLSELQQFWNSKKVQKPLQFLRVAKYKAKKKAIKVKNWNWSEQFERVESTYFVHKAIFHNANQNLPYSTLHLLGECLSNSGTVDKTRLIIEENVIKYDGEFLKLDVLENQRRVRKALRTQSFNREDKKVFQEVA